MKAIGIVLLLATTSSQAAVINCAIYEDQMQKQQCLQLQEQQRQIERQQRELEELQDQVEQSRSQPDFSNISNSCEAAIRIWYANYQQANAKPRSRMDGLISGISSKSKMKKYEDRVEEECGFSVND